LPIFVISLLLLSKAEWPENILIFLLEEDYRFLFRFFFLEEYRKE
jgi:hypothetical protein